MCVCPSVCLCLLLYVNTWIFTYAYNFYVAESSVGKIIIVEHHDASAHTGQTPAAPTCTHSNKTPAAPSNQTPTITSNLTPAVPSNQSPTTPSNQTPTTPSNQTPTAPGNQTPATLGNQTSADPRKKDSVPVNNDIHTVGGIQNLDTSINNPHDVISQIPTISDAPVPADLIIDAPVLAAQVHRF